MQIHPFHDGDSYATFQNLRERTVGEIDSLENDYALKASPTELEQFYVAKVSITPLTLDASGYYIDNQKGTQIDISNDFRRATFGRNASVKGTAIDIAIPYTGDCARAASVPGRSDSGCYVNLLSGKRAETALMLPIVQSGSCDAWARARWRETGPPRWG